jgi:hypothetical protein
MAFGVPSFVRPSPPPQILVNPSGILANHQPCFPPRPWHLRGRSGRHWPRKPGGMHLVFVQVWIAADSFPALTLVAAHIDERSSSHYFPLLCDQRIAFEVSIKMTAISPEYASQTKGPWIIGVFWAFFSVSVLMVSARLYIRSRMLKNIGSDDHIVAASMVCFNSHGFSFFSSNFSSY